MTDIQKIIRSQIQRITEGQIRFQDKENVFSIKSGTVVFALKYSGGVLVSGDKMISDGGKIYGEPYTKIRQISPFSVLAFSGSVYAFQVILEIYKQLLEAFALRASIPSLDNQIRILRNLQYQLDRYLVTAVSFIFAGIDPSRNRKVIVDFSDGCYLPRTEFAVTGCGEAEAETIIKSFLTLRKKLDLKSALAATLSIHKQAAERNFGVSHPNLIAPDIVLIKNEGILPLSLKKAEEIIKNKKGRKKEER